jgi:hypothetical protein
MLAYRWRWTDRIELLSGGLYALPGRHQPSRIESRYTPLNGLPVRRLEACSMAISLNLPD